jgi:hypothetical protein
MLQHVKLIRLQHRFLKLNAIKSIVAQIRSILSSNFYLIFSLLETNNLIINNISDVLKAGNYYFYNGLDTTGMNTLQGAVFNFTAYAPPGTNYSYSWNFGDGGTSTLANPAHQFLEPADYNVCLTVSNPGYPSKTICNVITMDTMCRFQFNQTMNQNLVSF